MYGWIWRHLPGDTVTRVFVASGVALVIGVALWYVVFPWVEPKIQFDHGTVEGGTSAPAQHSRPGGGISRPPGRHG